VATIKERLAILETQYTDMSDSLDTVVTTTKNIEKTLNELVGAKKVLMVITGFVATAVSIFVSWLGIHKQ